MTTVYDVPADELVKAVAEKLKKTRAIAMPRWCVHVKTGVAKELPPMQKDWWYTVSYTHLTLPTKRIV